MRALPIGVSSLLWLLYSLCCSMPSCRSNIAPSSSPSQVLDALTTCGDCVQGRGGAGLVASAAGDALFVIGGFAGHELNDVHRFDLVTRTWDCPECCSGAQVKFEIYMCLQTGGAFASLHTHISPGSRYRAHSNK